eukprot:CAMPEP_0170063172 /NCGR_PEP_ID=MMETSP0019_2-20121128/4142_1 /TAXON_ID=98059 /ORGANISM="Dinobryon sp., Strain UTEXLB2267" /LENGTH=306 /DNA_ID=CAMNT_0010269541 /DNA_START=57 /DNA_END=974 /DNA_ORIENTATION=-
MMTYMKLTVTAAFQTLTKSEETALPILRNVLKREGIKTTSSNLAMNPRDYVEMKRRIERAFSSTMLFLTAYYLSKWHLTDTPRSRYPLPEDLVFFGRVLVDKVSSHDRHLHMLLLCKGCLLSTDALSSKDTFLTGLSLHHGIHKPSNSARLLFPFLDGTYRAYRTLQRSFHTSTDSENSGVLSLLAFCLRFDRLASLSRSSTAAGEDMMSSIRRVLADKLSFLLINSPTAASPGDPAVTKNSLAMELFLWQQLTSSHAAALQRLLAEVGRYGSLFVRCVQRNRPNLASSTTESQFEENELTMLQLK